MKRLIWIGLCLALAACGTPAEGSSPRSPADPQPGATEDSMLTKAAPPTSLPDLGTAPELSNDIWLNVPAPLRLADLRGKVVAIEMWTFG